MSELIKNITSNQGFMPHGHCYLWNPSLVWTMVATDLLIGVAYVSIALSLYCRLRGGSLHGDLYTLAPSLLGGSRG